MVDQPDAGLDLTDAGTDLRLDVGGGLDERTASARTSLATTAKPRPASPARPPRPRR
jgi:hypothetical protein